MTRYVPLSPRKPVQHEPCLYCELRHEFKVSRSRFISLSISGAACAVWSAYDGDIIGVGACLIIATVGWIVGWRYHDKLAELRTLNRRELHPPYPKD